MYLQKLSVVAIMLLYSCLSIAQVDSSLFQLEEIQVEASRIARFSAGSKFQTLDSADLRADPSAYLSEMLMAKSPVYIKAYGHKQLGSISFRGTGAGHTAVRWNGMNIQSLTLGQSDFATLPVFALDQVKLQYGSASALHGTGAIGGSVLLDNQSPTWQKHFQVEASQEFGSFGHRFSGLAFYYGNQKLSGQTKLYHFNLDNDFEFEDLRGETRQQNNASVRYYGFKQRLNWRFNAKNILSLDAWYHHNYREIQPPMTNPRSAGELEDEDLRLITTYQHQAGSGQWTAKLGFVHDQQWYNQVNETSTKRYWGAIDYENTWGKWTLRAGSDLYHIGTQVDSYEDQIQENRLAAYTSLVYQALENWRLSLNLRQLWVEGFKAPFTPALGSDWRIFQKRKQAVHFKTSLSRSYRIPTLNDRFWNPGGNPNLEPEDGWSAEAGITYQGQTGNWQWQTEATHYQMWVNQWIIWQPQGSVWSPQNIRSVRAQGWELSAKLHYQYQQWTYEIAGNYAFTRSEDQKPVVAGNESQGNQLPYVPLHRAFLSQKLQYRSWQLGMNFQYTSLRYETLSNRKGPLSSIPAFALMNLSLSKIIPWRKHQWHLQVSIRNVWDEDYQNYIFRAMPGRNYQFSVRYLFQK